jgi:5-methylcytosine-specific restriction enzyme A
MPDKPLRPCREAGCGAVTRSAYCEKHTKDNTETERQRDNIMYRRHPWTGVHGFRRYRLMRNPMCQKLDDKGRACRNRATLVHHIISPRVRSDFFLVSSNCPCLCARCHPNTDGTPEWREGIDYAPCAPDEFNI